MAESVTDFNCSRSEQILRFKNSRSNVAWCAEVLEQHRILECLTEFQEQTSSSWWTTPAMGQNEKSSALEYLFRIALELGRCSKQAACPRGHKEKHVCHR
jgi:hypothetical protein